MNEAPAPARPLSGIRVVDLSTFVTGGYCTLMLAHLGADVIKVEPPGRGDPLRGSGPPFVEGESAYFLSVGSGKRSLALNLKDPRAQELLQRLASRSDVLVENFRPGTAARLGAAPEVLRDLNPKLVYCSISGFGQSGPWRDRAAYDQLVQGLSGLMAVTGEPERPPVKVGVPISDISAGMWAAFAVMGALLRRERTGRGDLLDIAMLDGMLPWLTKQAGIYFATGEEPRAMGSADPVIAPYRAFRTLDGWMNVAIGNDRLWQALCAALRRPDLAADPRFRTNEQRVACRSQLDDILEWIFANRSTEDWLELLAEGHGLPVGPILGVGEALEQEQAKARGVVRQMAHPRCGAISVLDLPLRYAEAETGFLRPPPLLGEHGREILEELGVPLDEAASLAEDGVLEIPDLERLPGRESLPGRSLPPDRS